MPHSTTFILNDKSLPITSNILFSNFKNLIKKKIVLSLQKKMKINELFYDIKLQKLYNHLYLTNEPSFTKFFNEINRNI